ncbi:SAM-dependent methyltransferase [Streptomyces sp. NPDC001493]
MDLNDKEAQMDRMREEWEHNRAAYGTAWAPATPVRRVPKDWHKIPASARLYNFLAGGDDHYQCDRAVFQDLPVEDITLAKAAADINLEHNSLVAAVVAGHSCEQFLDLGCGYPQMTRRPHRPDVHDAVLGVRPGAKVIYVDINTQVIAHRRMATETLGVGFVQGDLRDMETLLASDQIASRLDLSRPVALLMHDVLPWIADPDATKAMQVLRDWAPGGSWLSITHASDMAPSMPSKLTPILREVADTYEDADITYRPRSRDDIAAFFGDWSHLSPGLVPTHRWHRDHPHRTDAPHLAGAYAGIALKNWDA